MAYFESRINKCFHIDISEDEIRIVTNDSLVRFTLPEGVKDVDINDSLKVSLNDLSEWFGQYVYGKTNPFDSFRKEVVEEKEKEFIEEELKPILSQFKNQKRRKAMVKLEKRFKNSSGDIVVRETNTCGIVEMLYLYNKNKSGCVIGYWDAKKVDGEYSPEFCGVGDRITTTEFDDAEILLEALKTGQEFADLIVKLKYRER